MFTNDSGPALAPALPPALTTHAYDMDNGEIKARIAEIIRDNSREGAAPAG
jgi:hypothetical protein